MIRLCRALTALAALALIPAAAGAAKPAAKSAAKPAAKQDWTKTFTVTPEGGFRVGNPSAKIAIVEYGSLTCPHCRHFAETAMKPLIQQYVRPGKASYEYRSLVLNGIDLAATLVARCNGPAHFFPMAQSLYASQPIWTARAESLTDEDRQKLQSLPAGEAMVEVAKITGLIPVAVANGIAPARAQACLRDDSAAARLAEMYQAAMNRGITGTPTLFVNGNAVSALDWATLEPYLRKGG
jgi:protein-disulfide isomerase